MTNKPKSPVIIAGEATPAVDAMVSGLVAADTLSGDATPPAGEGEDSVVGGDADDTAAIFNGADPAAFDHDGDGRPGGSEPARVAVVLLRGVEGHPRGRVVRAFAARAGELVEATDARLATSTDLAVAGHAVRDL